MELVHLLISQNANAEKHPFLPIYDLLNRELGIGIVAYSPLGRGFFGGKAVLESLPTESLLVSVNDK